MPDPLRLTFEVACPVQHAFETWTSRINTWWPRDHTVSGADDAQIVLEQRVGGRLFERTPGGAEHLWGQVTAWEPPSRFAYRWHLAQDPANATDVEIRFSSAGPITMVEIEHTGWERLGDRGQTMRDRNRFGWDTLLPYFIQQIKHHPTEGERRGQGH